jgi:frataxin-like iron-binding protein CyaY
VINTQRPVRQLWLAGAKRAWHFDWHEETQRWIDDKGTGDELFAVIRTIVRDTIGAELAAR